MNPEGDDRGHFRRNLVIIAVLHVLVIGGLLGFSIWKSRENAGQQISWLDGGGMPVAAEDQAQASPTPDETTQPAQETPTPEPTPESAPTPDENAPPSQLALNTPTPRPVLVSITPTPTPTPRPTPKSTPTDTPTPTPKPKPSPKASPKPSPKASPHKAKPKPSASPHKHASPKPSPHKSPSPSDSTDQTDKSTPDDQAAQKAKATFKKATGRASQDASSGGDVGSAPGTGGGNRGGKGHAGGGSTEGDFGWYYASLHDRFYGRWIQPTSIVTPTSKFATVVKIRIEKDGTISDVSLAHSSGNDQMDQSVMDAARKVTQVDPLPAGLGDGGVYEVNINFVLSQQSQ